MSHRSPWGFRAVLAVPRCVPLLLTWAACGPPPPPPWPFAETVPIYATEDFDIPPPSGKWREGAWPDGLAREVLKPLQGRLGPVRSAIGFCRVNYDRLFGEGWVTPLASCFSVEAHQRDAATPASDSALTTVVREFSSDTTLPTSFKVVVKQTVPFAGFEFLWLTHPGHGKIGCFGEGQALVRLEESRVLVVLFFDGCAGTGSSQWRAAERVKFKPAP